MDQLTPGKGKRQRHIYAISRVINRLTGGADWRILRSHKRHAHKTTVTLPHNHMASWKLEMWTFRTWLKNISISGIIRGLNHLSLFIAVYYCLFIYHCIQAFA